MATNTTELLTQLLSSDALAGIAKATGATNKDVSGVLAAALPALLKGATSQSTSATTAESFAKALASHANEDTSNLSSFFKNVDLTDGAKIVGHLLGAKDTTAETASKKTGIDAKTVKVIMAAAAPLLMSLLGKQTKAKTSNSADVLKAATSLLGKTDVASIATLLLGGKKSGIDLTDGIDAKDVIGIVGKLIK